MSALLFPFQFGQPPALWLLIILPLLWLYSRRLSFSALLWRSVVLLLLILALADPRRVTQAPLKAGERIFAFDLSRSIPAEMKLWMARQNLAPRTGDRVFVFGGTAEEVTDWERRLKGEVASADIQPERTDLEALFSALLRLPRTQRSLFLFTDGWETDGAAERLLPALAQAGITVYPVLPPERPALANVAVKKIVAPNHGAAGEAVSLKVLVDNNDRKEADGSLVLKRNGQTLKSDAVTLKSGSQIFTYQTTVTEGPLVSFQAQFIPGKSAADLFPQDNQAAAWVGVQNKEKVLLLNGRSGEGSYLEELLKRRGFEVTAVTAGGAPPSPGGFGTIIFNNVEKEKFSPAYLGAVEQHVSAGNSLLVLGDESSLTPGGYGQTPIGRVLPVEIVEPKEKEKEKSRAVLLLIDTSRSMDPSANSWKEDRIPYAKAIAKRVIGQLDDDDLIGVIGFDVKAYTVVPLDQIKKIRPTFAAEIDRLVAKLDTNLLVAIKEGARQLQKADADIKHLIVITDADFKAGGPSPSDYIDAVSRLKNEGKIRVSAVGVGRGVDQALIKRLASYGGGVLYIADNLSRLPEIVFRTIGAKTPQAATPQERELVPRAARDSEILSGLSDRSFPPLKGYVESELKREARLDALIPHEGKSSPLLASWRYGKGKAVAFTADQAGRWSKDWIPWNGLERFWGKIFDWLRPEREILPAYEAQIDDSGDRPILDLYLYSEESDGNTFRYSYTSTKGARGEDTLQRLAPGHYRATLPFTAPADYRIDLREERGRRTVSYPPVGYTLPVKAKGEVFKDAFNLALLERVAESTGGTINPALARNDQTENFAPKITPLRSYLIFLCALFFLLEIFFRSFAQRESW
ncbi:MAG TPA: VWA domain-containing protein [Candidatus Binatia bacterium]|jgi:uncharacterized membrane protein